MADDDLYSLVYNGTSFTFRASDVETSGGCLCIKYRGIGAGRDNPCHPNIMEVSTSEHEARREKIAQALADFNAGVL